MTVTLVNGSVNSDCFDPFTRRYGMTTVIEYADVSRLLKHIAGNVLLAEGKQVASSGGNEEAVKLAQKLGLDQQAIRYQKSGADISSTFDQFRLSAVEMAIWKAFCPTVYVEGTDAFKAYHFETVPLEVLRYWNKLKEQHPFDRFEIWTTEVPEVRTSDPLLIGVFEGVHYLLARWGKEAEAILSFSQVCDQVFDRLHHNFTLGSLPEIVADTILRLNVEFCEQSGNLSRVTRLRNWENNFFIPLTHCWRKIFVFVFQDILTSRKKYLNICTLCGRVKDIS